MASPSQTSLGQLGSGTTISTTSEVNEDRDSKSEQHVRVSGGRRRVLRKSTHPATDTPGATVREVPLSHYDWHEVIDSMEGLLEAALGPEVAYWRTRGVTCEDVADTVARLHNVFLDSVKVVLIRNNTWHFLHPAAAAAVASREGASGPHARARASDASSRPRSGSKSSSRACTTRWRGACTTPEAPPTRPTTCPTWCSWSTQQKRWEVPWWGSNVTAPRLGRSHVHGELLPAMPLPSRVQQALDGADFSGAGATAQADAAGLAGAAGARARARAVGSDAMMSGGVHRGGAVAGGSGLRPSPKRRRQKKKKKSSKPGVRRALQQAAWREANVVAGRADGGLPPSGQVADRVGAGAGASGLETHSAERSHGYRETRRLHGKAAAAGEDGGNSEAGSGEQTGGGSGDKLWDMVRRFVASRPPDLPPGVTVPDGRAAPPPHGRRGLAPKKPPYDMDLLLPTMAFVPRTLIKFPWEQKKDVAFFSGVPFCPLYVDPHRICPRVFLANLSTLYPHRLDVRLVRPWTRKRLGAVGVFRQPVTLPQHPPTPISDHARYRWLLNVDGMSASTRMGFLMTTDSAILKSRSPFIEYYSRLQTPGSHYLEFWSNASDPYDVLAVLAAARAAAEADPAAVAAAAAANQAIAARYIALQPKLLYARAALLAYHSLVSDMGGCVRDLVERLEEEGEQQ